MTFAAMREQTLRFREAVKIVALWELRSLMRGWRAQLVLFICTAAICAIGLFVLEAAFQSQASRYDTAQQLNEAMARVGRQAFRALTLLEAGLILLLMPLLTAGTIGGERRRGTLEALLLTRLSALEIVTGKLFGASGFVAVLLLCALPVLSIVFLYGGVAPWELAGSQLLLLATAAGIGAVGIYCSARFRHQRVAVILTYLGAVLLVAVLCPALAVIPLAGALAQSWRELMGSGQRSCSTLLLGLALFIFIGVLCPLWTASALVLPMLFSPGIALGAMFWQGVEDYWWAMLLLPSGFLFLFIRLILAGAERQLGPRE